MKPQSFLHCFYNERNEPKDFEDLNKKCNASNIASDISSLKNFEVLQEGKIVNMIISPFPIDYVEDVLNGKTPGYNNMKRICFKNDGSNSSCADSDHQIGVVN
ncbi:hypothetical protein [Herbiconiux daphne]|uniref:Uncharacterized protein n=1 Tax=Herbiconiux daphne TaxID=2970914 RepID=A0ABT2H941_9MICO|nr:hypothetical protein [Herbiconiux daphne]MCS5736407.1 hypothetical protein [Herbiconiux daphne]